MATITRKISKALTWDELATEYDKYHNERKARTLPMDTISHWAATNPDKFVVSDEETIHKIL